jgi:uncharacterized protein with ParB-like and HNH nuclease domain
MANGLLDAITIKSAIDQIDSGDFLLPSIQRRFVWSTQQIEFLFDSIMQDYPINTFMFWEVTDSAIKNQFRFYDFLRKYIEYKGGNNEERKTKGYKNFKAVIDGQQRLNSLYIGLKGSYAKKKYVYHKKKYRQDEHDYPSKKLFLDVLSPIDDNDQKKVYDFRFLTHNEHYKENEKFEKNLLNSEGKHEIVKCFWFDVGEILEFDNESSVKTYCENCNLDIEGFSGKTLLKLYRLINEKQIINYFLETSQDFDKILYEFIRTNSGGIKLSFADLLMSIITASWETENSTKGVREEIDSLIRQIYDIGFEVNQDFILKICLVLLSNDIKFSLKNFKQETVTHIKEEWGNITFSIKSCFELVKSLSFNNHSLRAKNSIIPVIYWIYKNKTYSDLNKDNKHINSKLEIKKYIHTSLLNKIFSGSSDSYLKKIREIIKKNVGSEFPFNSIRDEFKGNSKNFQVSDDRIEMLLKTLYDNLDSFYILSLIYPKFNYEFKNPNIDHLHPISQFKDEKLLFLNDDDKQFYKEYCNSILNLALLSEEQNKSKNNLPLKEWIEQQETHNITIRDDLLIPGKVNLDFTEFKNFIYERQRLLKLVIQSNIESKA